MNCSVCKPDIKKVIYENVDHKIAMIETPKYGDNNTLISIPDKVAHMDVKDENGSMSLFLAACYDTYEIIELLIKRYAVFSIKEHCGWSALMTATFYNDFSMVEFLLDNGAEFNSKVKC